MKSTGYIYAAKFKDSVKIGCTRFPEERIKSLAAMNGCSNPEYFVSVEVENHLSVENEIHRHFKEKKIHSESFSISMDEAIAVINKTCKQVTDERKAELIAIHKKSQRDQHEAICNTMIELNKDSIEINDKLLESCISECNEWLDHFGTKEDAKDLLMSMASPIAVMAVSGRIKSRAIAALVSALNGDDSKLLELGFAK